MGISALAAMITVPGRVLAPPPINYRGGSVNPRDGSWNMMGGSKFTTSGKVGEWTYIRIRLSPTERIFQNGLNPVVQGFHDNMLKRGIQAPPPILPGLEIHIDDRSAVSKKIDYTFRQLANHPKRPRMVLVILPESVQDIYNRIKYQGDVLSGIHTICSIDKKIAKQQDQYYTNVAMKFNLKAGGSNQALDPSKLGILGQGKTMVVGLDVTHPSPDSKSQAPSIAGMVASVDRFLGQWPAVLRVQEARKEMVTDLSTMLESRLVLWRKRNQNALPENIIVYRDGVSEGQYQLVLDQEVPLLREACKKVYPAPSTARGLPRLSVFVVGKRHHTRFYPTAVADADRSSNPRNGTVVDRGVTEVQNWDFYMQAHTCLQGTARPAHYFIVLDEVFAQQRGGSGGGNVADTVEELTHNMSHLFGRATRAVSICPPAYYADLVCERARYYLSHVFTGGAGASDGGESEAGDGPPESLQDSVKIHAALVDSMFYI